MNEHLKGGLLIIASMFFFGFIGPFVRWINAPNTVFLFYGGLLGFIILIIYFLFKKRIKELWPPRYKWLILVTVLCAAVQIFTYFEAFKRTTFANTVLPHYTAPIFAAFFAAWFLKEKIDRVTIPALLLSFSGLYLIFFQAGFSLASEHTLGVILALISGIFYGLCIVCNKKLMMVFKPIIIMFYNYASFIIWIPFIKASEYILTRNQIILIIIYIIIISIPPSLLYLTGVKNVKGQHIGIIGYIEVLIVIVYGYLLFKEIPSWITLVGGALIVISGYMVLRAEAKRR